MLFSISLWLDCHTRSATSSINSRSLIQSIIKSSRLFILYVWPFFFKKDLIFIRQNDLSYFPLSCWKEPWLAYREKSYIESSTISIRQSKFLSSGRHASRKDTFRLPKSSQFLFSSKLFVQIYFFLLTNIKIFQGFKAFCKFEYFYILLVNCGVFTIYSFLPFNLRLRGFTSNGAFHTEGN